MEQLDDLKEEDILEIHLPPEWNSINEKGKIIYVNTSTGLRTSLHPIIDQALENLMMQRLPSTWICKTNAFDDKEIYINIETNQNKRDHPLLRKEIEYVLDLLQKSPSSTNNLLPTDDNDDISITDENEDEISDHEGVKDEMKKSDSTIINNTKDTTNPLVTLSSNHKHSKVKSKNSKLQNIMEGNSTIEGQKDHQAFKNPMNKSPIDLARLQIFYDYPKITSFYIIFTTILCLFDCCLIALPMSLVDVNASGMDLMPYLAPLPNTNLTATPQLEYSYRFHVSNGTWSYFGQVYILVLSTLAFICQLSFVNYYIDTSDKCTIYRGKIHLAVLDYYIKEISEAKTILRKLKKVHQLFWTHFDGIIGLEFFFLVYGWSTIFIDPALSVMRCFRLFRQFYYIEFVSDDNILLSLGLDHFSKNSKINPLVLENNKKRKQKEHEKWFNLKKALQISLHYLKNMGREFFSAASRGGTVVILMFFFVVYIFGVCFHHQEANLNTVESNTCGTLIQCCFLMARLAFYDGNGFDFMSSVIQVRHYGLFFLLVLYVIITGMILLNGLIGIYGAAFDHDHDEEGICQDDKEDNSIKENRNEIKEGQDRHNRDPFMDAFVHFHGRVRSRSEDDDTDASIKKSKLLAQSLVKSFIEMNTISDGCHLLTALDLLNEVTQGMKDHHLHLIEEEKKKKAKESHHKRRHVRTIA